MFYLPNTGIRKVIILLLLTISLATAAQNKPEVSADTDSVEIISIPLGRIPIVSLKTLVKIDQLAEELITEKQIEAEKIRNDSILAIIDPLIKFDNSIDFDSLMNRSLVNKKNFWKQYLEALRNQESRLEGIIEDLTTNKNEINKELKLWNHTKTVFDSTFADTVETNFIDEVLLKADSLNSIIAGKTSKLFSLLKLTTQYDVKIEYLILKIETIQKQRQGKIFVRTRPSVFQITNDATTQWNLQFYWRKFLNENQDVLSYFYQTNKIRIYLYLGYLVILILFFIFLLKRIGRIKIKDPNNFQQFLLIVLRRPVSVAMVLGIFSSGLFLSGRPPVLIDISIIILIVPILDIIARVTDKKGYVFLLVFGLLALLRFVSYIFPPTSPYLRIIFLAMGIIEIIYLYRLIPYLNIVKITSATFNYFVRLVIIFHLIASVVGVFATLNGQLRLAEIAIDLSITNTLVGLLLVISSLTLIGLIHLVIEGVLLKRLNFLQSRLELAKRKTILIIMFFTSLLWITYILQILRLNDIFFRTLDTILNYKISLGSVSFTAGKVILFFFVIYLSVVVSGMIRAILEDDVLDKVKLKKGVPRMISVVVRFSLISLGVLLAVSAVGLPLNQLTIIFGAFSVGIGFGLQNIVNNFVSGVILLFERPIQIGDTVEIGNLIGIVKSMGIRSSNVRTFDGAEVVVPNANLISNEVINWTLSDKKRRIEIISGVAYGSDVYKVQKILLDVLNDHPDILSNPEPLVLFNDLGESSLDFRLLFWTDNFDRWIIIKSEIIFKIHDALNAAGISIPFPQRDLHIKSQI